MNANALAAAKAYLNSANPAAKGATPAGTEDTGFGEMVAKALNSAVESGHQTENKITDVVTGGGNMVDVVTAVAETELALQSMVAVRDKVIGAYQEIMNMPI
ncbi:MAG: flagellar hook-basal body complex protein FliE [Rhodobiaceae bacterium]|nr:flagellar hook-basal body complex protein FliE [Rhodobiaceae bacterium]